MTRGGADGAAEPRPAPRGARARLDRRRRASVPVRGRDGPEAKRRRGDGDGDGDGDVLETSPGKRARVSVLERGGAARGAACGFRHDGELGTRAGAPGPYAAAVGPEGTSAGDGTEGDGRRFSFRKRRRHPSPGASPSRRPSPGAPGTRRSTAAAAIGDARPPSVRKNVKNDKSDRSGTATAASDQTLLKKLFAKEVRVDRARLLQVFRFLAANDFLRAETRLDALWVFPWADDPERDPQREKQRLRKLALEAAEAQEEEEEEETKR